MSIAGIDSEGEINFEVVDQAAAQERGSRPAPRKPPFGVCLVLLDIPSYSSGMEQTRNNLPTRSPAGRARTERDGCGLVRVSDRLASPEVGGTLRVRADGWTPDRIRTFLHALSECGVVADAARVAGMSTQGAYAFRNSARGRAFDVGWRAALLVARGRLADDVMSRAIHGCVEVIVRDGEVWGERHRHDNRLTMAVLTRLDHLAESTRQLDDGPRRVAHEFDAFVDAVCEGNAEAADFIHARMELPHYAFGEAEIVERNEAYRCAREGDGDVEWQP